MVAPDGVPAPDYATETEPETDPDFDDSGANWPTQYADLPLARLERWHAKRGPEGAHADVVDARAAVGAERSELHRVRDERDHYHAEVQDLRREVARLDRRLPAALLVCQPELAGHLENGVLGPVLASPDRDVLLATLEACDDADVRRWHEQLESTSRGRLHAAVMGRSERGRPGAGIVEWGEAR